MSKVFKVWPKRKKNSNGVVITPEMDLVVTLKSHAGSPFNNGAEELKEAYMRMYGVDLKKGCYSSLDFEVQKLD